MLDFDWDKTRDPAFDLMLNLWDVDNYKMHRLFVKHGGPKQRMPQNYSLLLEEVGVPLQQAVSMQAWS